MKKDGEIIERREQTDEKNREKIERGLEGWQKNWENIEEIWGKGQWRKIERKRET